MFQSIVQTLETRPDHAAVAILPEQTDASQPIFDVTPGGLNPVRPPVSVADVQMKRRQEIVHGWIDGVVILFTPRSSGGFER